LRQVNAGGLPARDAGGGSTADAPMSRDLAARLAALARPLAQEADVDAIAALAAGRDVALLGEASHGTHEFYALRAEITRRLVETHGFDAVCVEGDWPDVDRLGRYVLGLGADTLDAAFHAFERFPTWLWANTVVRDFARWLHAHNATLPADARVGMHGMDLYSLYRSIDEVLRYLDTQDPAQARLARGLYSCFDHVDDPQDYGASVAHGLSEPCRDAALAILVALRRGALGHDGHAGDGVGAAAGADTALARRAARDARFAAERNAHVVLSAEAYYRGMFSSRVNTWNLRDAHMVETLRALQAHLRAHGGNGRLVVWAHNSHLGDARATQMGRRGEWNVGQVLREQLGAERCFLLGFTTHTGHVTAARDWDGHAERRWVRRSQPGSIERLLHDTGAGDFWLSLEAGGEPAALLDGDRLERAIGVVYRPETELPSHYFRADVARQFDALVHIDQTTALQPLVIGEHWERHEAPDTYPSGL
jgi:erythromycin esterase-like protein